MKRDALSTGVISSASTPKGRVIEPYASFNKKTQNSVNVEKRKRDSTLRKILLFPVYLPLLGLALLLEGLASMTDGLSGDL